MLLLKVVALASLFALANAGVLLGGGYGGLGYGGIGVATGAIGYGGGYGAQAVDYYVSTEMLFLYCKLS